MAADIPTGAGRDERARARSGSGPTRRWLHRVADAVRARRVEALPEPVQEQTPEEVLDLLRNLGVALCRAGEAAGRVTSILDEVARTYDAHGVKFFVFPTGVFVRIETATSSQVDFEPGDDTPLRLDQIDGLYRLVDDIRLKGVEIAVATERLHDVLIRGPRFGPVVTVIGTSVLTVGLGLMLNPTATALPAYAVLGVVVGLLRWWADRDRLLELVLPVATSFVVTWLSFEFAAEVLDSPPLDIVIPSLVTLLPGAALTMATVELSAGSMISGASRLIYGLERLLLLTFGIAVGAEVAGLSTLDKHVESTPLGAWAPWLGVLVFGVGHFFASSAPRRTFGWLLVVLYVAYGVQAATGQLIGSLGGSFLAGAVVLPVAYAIQHRRSGPPVPVTFLPAFWMLVPGALGLQGVAEIVGADQASGLGDFLNALLSIVAIAVGVLVGSGFAERVGRATSTWRGT